MKKEHHKRETQHERKRDLERVRNRECRDDIGTNRSAGEVVSAYEDDEQWAKCDLCGRKAHDAVWRSFRDPYSGQLEEYIACGACDQNFREDVHAEWREDFGIS